MDYRGQGWGAVSWGAVDTRGVVKETSMGYRGHLGAVDRVEGHVGYRGHMEVIMDVVDGGWGAYRECT